MKDLLIFLLIAIIFLGLKTTVLAGIPTPDIPLIIIFFLAYKRPSSKAVVLCFVIGYLDDAFNSAVVGTTSFSLVLIFAVNHLISRRVHYSNVSMKALGCVAASLVKGILSYAIWRSLNQEITFLMQVVPVAIITGFFAPFIIAIFERLPSLSGRGSRKGSII